ncbi:hypothetical protein [Mycobacterium sp. Aquia_213]|uniref:hypothetical protein n=1 Tax=Mycobacterium sp. Aquia_213 TaxID=2991728 RepID=UPI00226FA293|nr:hypothetical protein [Mycobacterium sp. Aquia_213]WAC93009.1 hypothetical protein LMQ14_07700 [Mycobacterium sp. Aquia_213]
MNWRTLGGLAMLGIALVLTGCGSSDTRTGSSSSPGGVVTTLPGTETCSGRPPQNAASPDFYRQQYADGLATPLKERLKTYDSAVESGDVHGVGQAAGTLGTEIRAYGRMVDVPRLYGCYDQQVLAHLQNAAKAFANTLDALSCATANMCNRKQTEVTGIVAQAAQQERGAVEAFNAYAAQFGGMEIPARTSAARGWRTSAV